MAKDQALNGLSNAKKMHKSKKPTKLPLKASTAKKQSQRQLFEALERDVMDYMPPDDLKAFADLPISQLTKKGLKKASFVDLTDIQAKSIPISLKGKDVLGAARTGSGKTLAFLVPVLDILYRRRWSAADGLGALIISPTRELAVQIFEVLRSIGGYHSFSAGLVIGGKNLKDESDRLSRMNILVATPGRLLQHMDQTVGFDANNLQVLVLDEADRILDMGFQRTLSALLDHLPKSRQTLLFSATQTQSVTDLARLSLKDPTQIGIEVSGLSQTFLPPKLEQHYLLVELNKKLDVLWSFIKTHLQAKIIVFMSSCNQVRFVFETFCKMHPGVSLLQLQGKQKQSARLTMYQKFTTTSHAVLFATDIAARGLDFPSVDWVVQLDAPEDADTYIHRVGRTARYESKGKGLLFLLPSEEEGMKTALQTKSIEVSKIKNRPSKTQNIQNQLQNICFQDPEIKYLGQRAFVSYMRSIYLHKDKSIFKIEELPIDLFAESLGLPGTPKIKFLSKEIVKQKKNASRAVEPEESETDGEKDDSQASSSSGDEEEENTKPSKQPGAVRTKYDRMFERKNQNVLSSHYSKLIEHDSASNDDGSDDEFITLKRADHDLPESEMLPLDSSDLSKRKLKLGKAKQAIAKNGLAQKLVFDDAGKAHEIYEMADPDAWYKAKGGLVGAKKEGQLFAQEEGLKMRVADVTDKQEARDKKRDKKRKRKEKEKAMMMQSGATFQAPSDDEGYVSPEFDLPTDEEEEMAAPPSKKTKSGSAPVNRSTQKNPLDEEEELALRLLGRS